MAGNEWGFELREYPSSFRQPPHAHPWAVLNFVLRGRLEESNPYGRALVEPLNFYARPPDLVHSNVYDTDSTMVLVVTFGSDAESIRWIAPRNLYDRGPIIGALVRQVLGDGEDCESLRGELEGLLADPGRHPSADGRSCPSALERARDLLAAPDRLVGDVARTVGYHPVSFARAFRSRIGVRPALYRRWVRLRRVLAAIEPEGALADVALECGFSDQSHMCRDFRELLGISPRQWRDLLASARTGSVRSRRMP